MINKTEQEIMENWKGDISRPVVSVCTITYNHELYITEALDSFLMQETDFPFEIVIRDDNSMDNTYSIIQNYVEKYPTLIRLLDSSKNIGMNNNFMSVFTDAKGEYIALCEGDDYWCDNNKLQYQYNFILKDIEIDFLIHACYSVNSKSEILKQNNNRFFGHDTNQRFVYQDILSYPGQFAPTSSYFIKSSILKQLPNWFNEAPIGDIFIELYAAKENGGIYLPKIMSCYRVESIGSWTDKMKKVSPQKKIEYAEKMIIAIENMKKDFSNNSTSFDKKINALRFIMATSFLDLNDFKKFKKLIQPLHNLYISRYHKLLNFTRNSFLLSKGLTIIYKMIKKLMMKKIFTRNTQ